MDASGALNLPDPNTHIPYEVIDQQPRQELVGNRFIDGMEITYRGPAGVTDRIFIPESEYTPANVDRAIQDKLLRIESVHALGAQPHPDNLAAGA